MQAFVVLMLFLLCCTLTIVSSLIGCRNEGIEILISNFNGHGEENSNIFFCKGKSVIRTYNQCHVNYIKLPIEDIVQRFPSVRIVNWACTGQCRVDLARVEIAVKGCLLGELFFQKILYSVLYCILLFLFIYSLQSLISSWLHCFQSTQEE